MAAAATAKVNGSANLLSIMVARPPSEFNLAEATEWMDKNWTISVYASAVYIVLIFLGHHIVMKNREAMDLRRLLTVWNFVQAIFSAMVAMVIFPEFLSRLLDHGFSHSVCGHSLEFSKEAHFWGWMFLMSKFTDLGDTAFLVLRKKKLIPLHWYHHVTALIVGFHGAKEFVSVFAWFGTLNSVVHSFMYTYYGLMAMGVKIPKRLAMSITVMQLLQMATALVVIGHAYYVKAGGHECHTSYNYLNISVIVAASYLFLFGNYFRNAYLTSGGGRKGKDKST